MIRRGIALLALTCTVVVSCFRGGLDSLEGGGDAGADADADLEADADADSDADVEPDAAADADLDGPSCEEVPCRVLQPQCGCGEGETCGMEDRETIACRAAGHVPRGGVCTDDEDCAPGLGCAVPFAPTGVCEPYCSRPADCGESETAVCLGLGSPEAPYPFGLCAAECDPESQTGCPDELACGFDRYKTLPDWDRQTTTHCRPVGTAGPGAPCTDSAACDRGSSCVFEGDGTYCLQICRVGGVACPESWQLCTPHGTIPTGEYGYCMDDGSS